MLVETDIATFRKYFPVDANPFISEKFIELNKGKVDRVVRLVDNSREPLIGLVAGIKNGVLKSPFSAPFGGFHFRKDNIYISEVDGFIALLEKYALDTSLQRIELITPPDIYHMTFNAKVINSLCRHNFHSDLPDITSWVDLANFKGTFSQKNSREYFRQAQRNNLIFSITNDENEKKEIYDLIRENRARFARPIHMTLNDIIAMDNFWPVDFFKVVSAGHKIVASAIFYRCHDQISYAVFWGDNDEGRPLRAMDFLLFNLFLHYKEAGFKYIDLGISTESGIPNEGLLRFKESHEAVSSVRYKFILEINKA